MMKTFQQLASEGFAAFEKERIAQLAEPIAPINRARAFSDLSPEEKARWVANAKQIVAHYAAMNF